MGKGEEESRDQHKGRTKKKSERLECVWLRKTTKKGEHQAKNQKAKITTFYQAG